MAVTALQGCMDSKKKKKKKKVTWGDNFYFKCTYTTVTEAAVTKMSIGLLLFLKSCIHSVYSTGTLG
jgi:hypothetical protein